MPLFQEYTQAFGSELVLAEKAELPACSKLSGSYQEINFGTVLEAMKYICQHYGKEYDYDRIAESTKNISHWGRMTHYSDGKRICIFDGAHNIAGMQACFQSLKTLHPSRSFVVVMGVLSTKNLDDMLEVVSQNCKGFRYCEWSPDKNWPYEEVCLKAEEKGLVVSRIKGEDIFDIDSDILVCGSLYFIASLTKKVEESGFFLV